MTPILAIDPGNTHSGWVEYHPETHEVYDMGFDKNEDLADTLRYNPKFDPGTILVVEYITSYGMAVGASIFDTMFWTGRFVEAWITRQCKPWKPMTRPDVKLQLCGSMRAKDPNVRRAVLDRFPPTGGGTEPAKGTKNNPGPLYGVSRHILSALAVAVAYDESQNDGRMRWDRMRTVIR